MCDRLCCYKCASASCASPATVRSELCYRGICVLSVERKGRLSSPLKPWIGQVSVDTRSRGHGQRTLHGQVGHGLEQREIRPQLGVRSDESRSPERLRVSYRHVRSLCVNPCAGLTCTDTGQASYQQQPRQSSSAYASSGYSSSSHRTARPSAATSTTDRLRAEYTRPERRRAESPEPTAAAGWSSSIKKAVWGEQDGSGRPAAVARSNSSTSVGTWDTSRWQKMMDSAYTATSNVSAKFVSRVTGNEEPSDEPGPDGDTHLTRVIKEYHISKATSSNDLPTWLFPERQAAARQPWEAGPTRSRPSGASRPAATLDPYAYSASSISSSGSSSMFDESGRHGPSSSMSSTTSSQRAYGAAPSSAANRLKAMRDEKRAR